MRSLKFTLSLAFIGLCLLVELVTTGMGLYANYVVQKQSIAREQQYVAENAARVVENYLKEKVERLATVAQVGRVFDVAGDKQKIVLSELLGMDPAVRTVVLFDENFNEVNREARLANSIMNEAKVRALREGFGATHNNYSVSQVYFDEESSEPVIFIAFAIRDVVGDLRGFIVTEQNLKFMWDLIDTIKVGEKGLVYVVDEQGNLLAFSDVGRVLRGENLSSLEEVKQALESHDGEKHVYEASIEIGLMGDRVVSEHAHVQDPSWAVIIELPVMEAFSGLIQQMVTMGVVLGLSMLLATILGVYLSRKITKPLDVLAESAVRIGQGKYDQEIKIQSHDEIGKVGVAFNTMMKQINAYYQQLEGKVSEKTAELEQKVSELEKRRGEEETNKLAMLNLLEDSRQLEEDLTRERESLKSEIVERKKIEVLVRESEQRLKMILEAVKEGITLSDDEGKFYVYNTEMEVLTGYSMLDANESKNFYMLLHPSGGLSEELKDLVNFKVGEKRVGETTMTTKSGEVKYLLVSTVVVEDQGRRMYLTAYHDITELKKAEKALIEEKAGVEKKVEQRTYELKQKSEDLEQARKNVMEALVKARVEVEKTQAILQSIGDGVFVLDRDKKIVLVNEVACSMSGFVQDELLGQEYSQKLRFIYEDSREENSEFIRKVYETGNIATMMNHTLLIRKDLKEVQVADSAAPLKSELGVVEGCVVVFRDISKEREVESMKDDFISIASHQLRTPLTAIRWKTQRLSRESTGPLNEKQAELIRELGESSVRLEELVTSLLNISRLESGRMVVEPEAINVDELVKSVLQEVEVKTQEKNQKVEYVYNNDLPVINLDTKLIRQVIINLLTNASKYSGRDTILHINLHREGEEAILVITDQGMGIPKEEQEKVFGKFFRASNISGAEFDGTGLGLYLVKKIMEVSGGRIWFQSEVGKGSTFSIALPISGSQAREGEVHLSS